MSADGPVMDQPNMEQEAYEPTYAEAFPPLPGGGSADMGGAGEGSPTTMAAVLGAAVASGSGGGPAMVSGWNSKMSMRSSTVTQVFCVPLEERRFKEMAEQQFGEKGGQQAKICSDIKSKTEVSIEMSLAKDQSLTVVITGKGDSVTKARRMVVQQLQMQAKRRIAIPKEHHRFILGTKGKRLQNLEMETATKITIPRSEENSDQILISGSKDGIERAAHEIQLISDEQAKLAFERLPIQKVYHPFICGPDNQKTKALMEETGSRISVPPPSVDKDEIVVSGEREGVRQAIEQIMAVYEEKKRNCKTVSVEVKKTQHKYVIGPKGSNLNEILSLTGVSVEVPSLESGSETITLRGEQDKLGPALTMVYSKANSVVIRDVNAPAWLHKYIIGKGGESVKKITQDLPKVHIEFTDGEDKIVVEGPPEEVEQAFKALQDLTKDLLKRMAFVEIDVDQKYHKHIIGRAGANVSRIKAETGVAIRIPADSNIIRIEGTPEGVARAKSELIEMVQKMENEKSRDILIEPRFHKTMIGASGGKIREIREKFNQVQVTFPDAGRKSAVVTLRGPKGDVDRCYKYLQVMHQELIVSNYAAEVHIFKQFHKNIIGKGGANIKKIRDETDTKIDLPSENAESDVITITGKKENVDKAKVMIEAIQKELANIKEVTIEIPHRFHNSIIGAKGRLIRSIMEECGGCLIRFPPEGTSSDKVVIRGPKDDVENARKQLMELAEERKDSGHTCEVRCKPEYHKFLIGRGGVNIKKVRDSTGARVIFPSPDDQDKHLIIVMGKKENVEQARAELELLIKDLDNITEGELSVDPKHHRHFVARRGAVLQQIAEDFGGVIVSFPRLGVSTDKVKLKGSKDCVEGAKKRILDIVADLDAQVTLECVIPQKYHRTVMGAKGYKVQEITKEFDVGVKFPDRPPPPSDSGDAQQETPTMNGDAESESSGEGEKIRKCDIIIITGKQENAEAAKAALQSLVPVTEEMQVPFDFHRFIIGQRGRDVRKMMEDHDVNISIPPAEDHSDIIKITGPPQNVAQAHDAMLERIKQLEGEKEDRALRSFALEVEVDPKYHPKIIGRRGMVITKIRTDHDVNIQFPDRGSEHSNIITVTGYEDQANAAKEDILKIVGDLEDMISEEVKIDHRIHSRLIGSRGRAIRKIMDDFKVDIKFPNRESGNPDIVTVTGAEDDVMECKDHLLNLEEEYMQDVHDAEMMDQYKFNRGGDQENGDHPRQAGFTVRNAPWSNAPDTSSMQDFPTFGASVEPTKEANPISWGPRRKR